MMQILMIGSGIQSIQDWIAALGVPEALAFYLTAVICVVSATLFSVGLMCLLWRYRKTLLRDRDLRLDKFTAPGFPAVSLLNALRIPVPKFSFDLSGFKGVGTALTVVGVAFALAFTFVIAATDDTPVWPEAGAEYALPGVFGDKLDPDPETPGERSQTLRVGFKDKSRLDRVVLKNLDLGKANLSKSFEVIRNATTGVTGAQAYLWIGEVVITNSSAPTLAWDNMDIGTTVLGAKVDGHTQEIQFDQTIPELVIDSDRGSGTYVAQDSHVDRVILQINGTNGASIGILEIDNVDASVGAWDWDYMKIGKLTMDNTNEFGNGTGINSASATFGTSISSRQVTDTMVDTPISVR
jgi:hypothetical protein